MPHDEPKILNLGELLKQAASEPRDRHPALLAMDEAASLRAQLAAVTAQRDELLLAARRASDDLDQMSRATRLQTLCVSKQLLLQAVLEPLREAIARAQPEQPQQPKEADHG